MVNDFLDDKDADATLSLGADMKKINCCFQLIKTVYNEMKSANNSANDEHLTIGSNQNRIVVESSHYENKEITALKDTLKQRDNEISKRKKILINLIHR
jgi:hypothetical protein